MGWPYIWKLRVAFSQNIPEPTDQGPFQKEIIAFSMNWSELRVGSISGFSDPEFLLWKSNQCLQEMHRLSLGTWITADKRIQHIKT